MRTATTSISTVVVVDALPMAWGNAFFPAGNDAFPGVPITGKWIFQVEMPHFQLENLFSSWKSEFSSWKSSFPTGNAANLEPLLTAATISHEAKGDGRRYEASRASTSRTKIDLKKKLTFHARVPGVAPAPGCDLDL